MRGGDLSADLAPAVGFRFERLIKTEEGKLNRTVKGYIQNAMHSTDANVVIITTGDQRKALAFCVKWNVPYTHVIAADSLLEIPTLCNEHELVAYYDYDMHVLQNVRARGKEQVNAIQWTLPEHL